jgi:hypothetical protein
MKNKLKTTLSVILLLTLTAGISWIALVAVAWFGSLQKEVAAAILAALTAVTISILSLVLSKQYERRADIRKEHREKKVPIYEKSIKFWFEVLMADKAGRKPPSEQKIIQFLQDFTQELIVWGSDSVLKAFITFREALISYKGGEPPIEGMFLFEKYMLEVRRDLGHKNKNLSSGDILALFINDIRKYTGGGTGAQSGSRGSFTPGPHTT